MQFGECMAREMKEKDQNNVVAVAIVLWTRETNIVKSIRKYASIWRLYVSVAFVAAKCDRLHFVLNYMNKFCSTANDRVSVSLQFS